MAILHLVPSGQLTDPNGNVVDLDPRFLLADRGPCVQVTINVADSVAAQLTQQGIALPTPQVGLALIDTGASMTCVDDVIAQSMGLPVVDVVQMTSASHAAVPQNCYPIRIDLPGNALNINADRAMGANLQAQGLIALIGRDVLQHCTLFYNGISGHITLSM